VEKCQGNENLQAIISSADNDRSKQLVNVEYSKYLGSIITNDARRISKIKSRTAMPKAVFNLRKNLLQSKLDLNLRNGQIKCYIWSTASYNAGTWTLRKVDTKYTENAEE